MFAGGEKMAVCNHFEYISKYPSNSCDEKRTAGAMHKRLAEIARQNGAPIEMIQQDIPEQKIECEKGATQKVPNYVARIPGGPAKQKIVLSFHMDCENAEPDIPVKIVDGKYVRQSIDGRKAELCADDLAGAAIIVAAVEKLLAQLE